MRVPPVAGLAVVPSVTGWDGPSFGSAEPVLDYEHILP
jgi:hypothetical protein